MLTDALRHTAESLSSTLDYGEVLDQILATVGTVAPSDAATIMLINDGKALVVRSRGYVERGLVTAVMELELLLRDTANLRQMLSTGKPVIVPDTVSFPGWKASPANEWVRSNVGAPILLDGDVIGFILLDSGTPDYFTPLHAEHLEAFSNQAALAIHNSRLLQKAQVEIAARIRTEDALRDSEERFRLIAQNAEYLIWTMNMDFVRLSAVRFGEFLTPDQKLSCRRKGGPSLFFFISLTGTLIYRRSGGADCYVLSLSHYPVWTFEDLF